MVLSEDLRVLVPESFQQRSRSFDVGEEECGCLARRGHRANKCIRCTRLALPAVIPIFTARDVYEAVSPQRAVKAVREAFVAYAKAEWSMPPKVYVPAYPAGDFRAMPALGAGHALLKWVTSFPGNPAKGLPTVTGLVLLSSAEDGRLVAALDASAVTALRTGAAAVLAAESLCRPDAKTAAVVGAGVNGRAVARAFLARGRKVRIHDLDPTRAEETAAELGADTCALEEALAADVVATVTPAQEPLYAEGSLRSGQHVSLMGADGPGKAEIAAAELARVSIICDDWEQASHNGDLAQAVAAGLVVREQVTELGRVLAGQAPGRNSPEEITVFDSTGLAIQDLAIALAALERADERDLPGLEL
ncbi:MAG: ornithine cyclodeaminase family protein [Candidatus Rokuibacteriota bacterium]|nr:MAG: ornithine cyclodeaminase family protein [Candidatus Rokubacteria bacterium]